MEEGSIEICVQKKAGEGRINSIVQMIGESEHLKAGIQGKAERLADSIVPFSFAAFGMTLLLTRNLTKAMSVLMVDYSCALKLSIPIAVISGMREAADHQILVKGGKFLETLCAADTIIFDKTGTLTSASPSVVKVVPFGENDSKLYAAKLAGTNELHIVVCGYEEQTSVTALFDNLGKGASGAAVQNMNIMLGLSEDMGL